MARFQHSTKRATRNARIGTTTPLDHGGEAHPVSVGVLPKEVGGAEERERDAKAGLEN